MEIDLTQAVEAAARAAYNESKEKAQRHWPGSQWSEWEDVADTNKHHWRESVLTIVHAASTDLYEDTIDLVRTQLVDTGYKQTNEQDADRYFDAANLILKVME